jgi:phage terminase large subunit-like protein
MKKIELEDLILKVDYYKLNNEYIPSTFALEFINFIKLVNGPGGEENTSPVIHMDMLDQLLEARDNLFVAFRGSAKTSVIHEYLFLYMACFGGIPGFGNVDVAIYVSDTIDNGVKSMRQQLQYRWLNSDFLQYYIPEDMGTKFTETRWEFVNRDGKKLCIRGFGASTGVRGFKEYGKRPTWCGMDDLMSDKNAESPTIIKDITNIVYKAARQALHPKKRMIAWTGTPFNKKDPLYTAAGSRGWNTRVYPICEKWPCTKEEFRGAWEDRFPYEFVKTEYDKLLASGQVRAFNQELMLKIVSDDDRLVAESDIMWYERASVLRNKPNFNFYISTDYATSEEQSADYSTTFVWAYSNHGDWYWVDGEVKRQLMDKNVDCLFRYVPLYKPQQVGVEVSGQQGGFIPWLKREMMDRNIFFNFVSENNKGKEGIRPVTKKIQRFNLVVPWFKAKKMYFPIELKGTPEMQQIMDEIHHATMEGFKSRNDDCVDNISQLSSFTPWRPSAEAPMAQKDDDDIWAVDEEDIEESNLDSYIV